MDPSMTATAASRTSRGGTTSTRTLRKKSLTTPSRTYLSFKRKRVDGAAARRPIGETKDFAKKGREGRERERKRKRI